MKTIIKNSFYQLLAIYTAIILVIALGFLGRYALYFNILALIIAILGISIINVKPLDKESKLNNKLHFTLILIAIILILAFRIIPYINNSIPIGYDAGIYKYGIESFKENGFQAQDWIKASMSPLFLYLTFILSYLFSSQAILTWLFILSCLILGITIYFFTKEYFGEREAIISFLIYSVSIIQFKVFEFLYYKNILALIFLFLALIFYKREKRALFIIFSVLTGAMHLPTFYIFALSFLIYTFISPIKNNNKKYNFKLMRDNILNGLMIIILTLVCYFGFIKQAILPLISPVASSFINPGTASGTFLSFFQYQFLTLAYLPFSILGLFFLIKSRKFNLLFFLTLVTASIVYFQLFFFNRFIIHLDIFLIILASLGFSIITENKKKLGTLILALMLLSSAYLVYNESINTKPGITQSQLDLLIQQITITEQNSSIISISSQYSPYVLAYSGRKTIAPGLFDENKWNLAQWNEFWATQDTEKTKELLSVYNKPIYLFAGNKAFNNTCFSLFLEKGANKIYQYIC